MSDTVLQEQVEYYQARAAEYDEWFYRQGRYDQGEALNQKWFDEAGIVQDTLLSLGHFPTILELASGTGIWTQELLKIGDRITALDAAPEMMAINQHKVNSPRVEYQQADLFAWEPAEAVYDLVYFSFWLSHVPPERLETFLSKVYRALKPGGVMFMVDSLRESTSTAMNQPLQPEGEVVQKRILNDGRKFRVIKIYYDPSALNEQLRHLGFDPHLQSTEQYFVYGHAHKPV